MQLQQFARMLKGSLFASLVAMAAQPALAADTPLFSADHYGKAVIPLSESLGNAADLVGKQGNTFEPISRLRADDPVRQRARAVGRLDLLVEQNGKQALSTCTASVVASDLLLTNYHCVPGHNVSIKKASFLLDYVRVDGNGSKRIDAHLQLVEGNKELDYAIIRLKQPVPRDVKPLAIDPMLVKAGQRLTMIHHPAGQVKKMSSFSCYAAPTTPANSPYLRHVCDTLPGSSGGVLFNRQTNAVGLHHTGGLDKNNPESYNMGTLFARLVAASQSLKQVVSTSSRQPGAPAQPPASPPANGFNAPGDNGAGQGGSNSINRFIQ